MYRSSSNSAKLSPKKETLETTFVFLQNQGDILDTISYSYSFDIAPRHMGKHKHVRQPSYRVMETIEVQNVPVTLDVPHTITCPKCMGDDRKSQFCTGCLGVKRIDEDYKACPKCYGSGKNEYDDCISCGGYGYVSKHFEFCDTCKGEGQVEVKIEEQEEETIKICPVCFGGGVMIRFVKKEQ